MTNTENHPKLTTEKFANQIGIKPHTARRAYCLNGHYMGCVPTKLPNGRLLWNRIDLERLLNGDAK